MNLEEKINKINSIIIGKLNECKFDPFATTIVDWLKQESNQEILDALKNKIIYIECTSDYDYPKYRMAK